MTSTLNKCSFDGSTKTKSARPSPSKSIVSHRPTASCMSGQRLSPTRVAVNREESSGPSGQLADQSAARPGGRFFQIAVLPAAEAAKEIAGDAVVPCTPPASTTASDPYCCTDWRNDCREPFEFVV